MTREKAARFLHHIEELCKDRGARAALRRTLAFGLDELGEVRAYRYVEPFVQTESEWHRRVFYLVAGLYAFHPEKGDKPLAEVLSDLRREAGSESLEKRVLALLESDEDQLPDRLRRIVAYVRSKRKSFDYHRLLSDLLFWQLQARPVQQRWAREFYRVPAAAAGEPRAGSEPEVQE